MYLRTRASAEGAKCSTVSMWTPQPSYSALSFESSISCGRKMEATSSCDTPWLGFDRGHLDRCRRGVATHCYVSPLAYAGRSQNLVAYTSTPVLVLHLRVKRCCPQ